MFIAALVFNQQKLETMSTSEWLKNLWYIHTIDYYSSNKNKKEWTTNTPNNMNEFQNNNAEWMKPDKNNIYIYESILKF